MSGHNLEKNIRPFFSSNDSRIEKSCSQAPETPEDWKRIEDGFRRKWNFPDCCGALGGKHVIVNALSEARNHYQRKNKTVVLMALVDDDYCFSYIDIEFGGRVSDRAVFRKCSLNATLKNNLLPENHIVVGNETFPLKPYIMVPYTGNNLTRKQKVFNYRLLRAQLCFASTIADNAFGTLVARFRIFERQIPVSYNKVEKIVKACCALHNWMRKTKSCVNAPTVDKEDTERGCVVHGNWKDVLSEGFVDLRINTEINFSDNACAVRDK